MQRYNAMPNPGDAFALIHEQLPPQLAAMVSDLLFPKVDRAHARRMVKHWQHHLDDPRLADRIIEKALDRPKS
jgi:hypothetical protein